MRLFTISLLLVGIFLAACATSEKEIAQMKYKCEEQGIINSFGITLSFPNVEKIKKIKINRIKDGTVIETFEAYPEHSFVSIDKDFYTHDTYEFIIDGEKPFILNNVKTKLNFHCPMFLGECKVDCGIKEGKMNGKLFGPTDGGIRLQKEGYKEVWEK